MCLRRNGEFKVTNVEKRNLLIKKLQQKYGGKIDIQSEAQTPDGNIMLVVTHQIKSGMADGCNLGGF